VSGSLAYTSGAGGLDRIYDGIEAVLPGVQHPMVQLVLWDAIEEFCTRSTAWRLMVGWEMAPGVTTFNLNPLDDVASAVHVLDICGPIRVRLKPPAILVDTGDTSQLRSGTAKVAAKPRRLDEEVVPAFLVNEWSEALRDGALHRLYMQPFKPYTSPQLAGIYGKKFRAAITLALIQAKRATDCSPHFPYFARGRQRVGWPGGACCPATPLDIDLGGTGAIDPPVSTLPPVSVGPGVITATLPLVDVGPGIPSSDATVGLSFGASSVSFPATPVGETADSILTLTNSGTAPLVISGITVDGDFFITGMELA
jgi:hypothetical protein